MQTGGMGTMLARLIQNIATDQQYGLPYDLYKSTWTSQAGFQWQGLGLHEVVQTSGMYWLRPEQFNWQKLLFQQALKAELRFFAPYSKTSYKERSRQVFTINQLYQAVNQISKFLGSGAQCERHLKRLRRVCYLALTIQILQFNTKHRRVEAPDDLAAYNYGVCYNWLRQYYTGPFCIPHTGNTSIIWKEPPTWANLLQQLFGWDDQYKYKKPFNRERWDRMEYRLITRHAYHQIEQRMGKSEANKWKVTLGLHATRFFWVIPKCTPNRFPTRTKRTTEINSQKKRVHKPA